MGGARRSSASCAPPATRPRARGRWRSLRAVRARASPPRSSDPRALLTWQPLAQRSRASCFPAEFAALDRAAGGAVPVHAGADPGRPRAVDHRLARVGARARRRVQAESRGARSRSWRRRRIVRAARARLEADRAREARSVSAPIRRSTSTSQRRCKRCRNTDAIPASRRARSVHCPDNGHRSCNALDVVFDTHDLHTSCHIARRYHAQSCCHRFRVKSSSYTSIIAPQSRLAVVLLTRDARRHVHCLWCHYYDLEAFRIAVRTPRGLRSLGRLVGSDAARHREHRARLSDDLLAPSRPNARARAPRVIVHGNDADARRAGVAPRRQHRSHARRRRRARRQQRRTGGVWPRTPRSNHLSGDTQVQSSMSVSIKATAADQTRAGSRWSARHRRDRRRHRPGHRRRGRRLRHLAAPGAREQGGRQRQLRHRRSVGRRRVRPRHARRRHHRRHGIAATNVTPLYNGGIAPGAQAGQRARARRRRHRPDERRDRGHRVGRSHNRARYNIRVINLSLGHPVIEPCATDPLCQAVADAPCDAGIVVVAAAGNYGQVADGRTRARRHHVAGQFAARDHRRRAEHAGAPPGAATTRVTTYSSRGPTRYDIAVKPDIAAPGNKIISLEATRARSCASDVSVPPQGRQRAPTRYMQLSGTSMAAPMVSGGVALLLQGTPILTPAQVKLALQTGATYMPDGGLMGAGAGSVNFWASRKLRDRTAWSARCQHADRRSARRRRAARRSGMPARWPTGSTTASASGCCRCSRRRSHWLNPSLLQLRRSEPARADSTRSRRCTPKRLLCGQIGGWTERRRQIIWGDTVYDPQGQADHLGRRRHHRRQRRSSGATRR